MDIVPLLGRDMRMYLYRVLIADYGTAVRLGVPEACKRASWNTIKVCALGYVRFAWHNDFSGWMCCAKSATAASVRRAGSSAWTEMVSRVGHPYVPVNCVVYNRYNKCGYFMTDVTDLSAALERLLVAVNVGVPDGVLAPIDRDSDERHTGGWKCLCYWCAYDRDEVYEVTHLYRPQYAPGR